MQYGSPIPIIEFVTIHILANKSRFIHAKYTNPFQYNQTLIKVKYFCEVQKEIRCNRIL